MKLPRRMFGRLHNQIVVPLLAASLTVAVLATIIAVNVVASPVLEHARRDADSDGRRAQRVIARTGENLVRGARLMAEDPAVTEAVLKDDSPAATRLLVPAPKRLGVDGVSVLDGQGRVVITLGDQFDVGQVLSDRLIVRQGLIEMSSSDVVDTKRGKVIAGVSAVRDQSGVRALIMVTRLIGQDFLFDLSNDVESQIVYFDGEGDVVASTLGRDTECLIPYLTPSAQTLREASRRGALPAREMRCPEGRFFVAYVLAQAYGSDAGLVAVVRSTAEVAATQRPTAGLIALWSLVAVIFLGVFGFFIAQSVTFPITELAGSVRRVASGDLTPRIDVKGGPDEIRELAGSFNLMTEGLRARQDDLTKRLLELSTLYEMSKAVGATLDAQHMLETVLDSALKVLGADVGYVMLLDRQTGQLELKAWRAPADVLIEEQALSNSIGSWVVREGKPLVFGQRSGIRPSLEFGTLRTRSALCVPMKAKNTVKGVVTVAVLDSDTDLSQENVNLMVTIANQAAIALENAELFDSLQQAYLATVRALAAAVDAKDPYTHGHSEQVARYAMVLADAVGVSEAERDALETAAYLHDIGKIGVKDEILLKPGRLTADEMNQIRHHPLIGANILAPVPFPWAIMPVVRHHHEHWDGAGYPAGLVGEEIPKLARILAVADAFEAMTSDRPYRTANSYAEAAAELRRFAGTQFDPGLVEPFLAAIEEETVEVDNVRVLPTVVPEWADEDEIMAVFVSVADSLLGSLRRLGGPRVASNFSQQMNAHLRERGVPAAFEGGHLTTHFDDSLSQGERVAALRDVLSAELYAVERSAGSGIAEHFFSDAIEQLPQRHQDLATHFGLDQAIGSDAS